MKKENFFIFILVVALALVLVIWYMSSSPNVGLSPSETQSSVTVGASIAIDLSPNLANGIDFNSVAAGQNDVAASDNTNGIAGATTLNVTRNPSTNTDIKVCIYANGNLVSPQNGATISLNGETYSFASTTNPSGPAGSTILTTTPTAASGTLTAASPAVHYRVWLDVPSNAQAGSYNNTISFVAVQASASC